MSNLSNRQRPLWGSRFTSSDSFVGTAAAALLTRFIGKVRRSARLPVTRIYFSIEPLDKIGHAVAMSTDSDIAAMRAEISALRAENVALRAEIKDVRDAIVEESNDSTKHFRELYQRSGEMFLYVMPIIEKTFPEMAKDLRRLEAFFQGRIRPPEA